MLVDFNLKTLKAMEDRSIEKICGCFVPGFSLQEITCLTSALSVWFGEKIEFLASENREYRSEEGLKTFQNLCRGSDN